MITRRPISKPFYHGQIPPDLCFMDIETLPSKDPAVWLMLSNKIKPPGNMTKPETIAKWEQEEAGLLLAESIKKTGLDGAYGSICCISWAFSDGKVESAFGDDERGILETFFQATTEHRSLIRGSSIISELKVSGHNIRSFDLRFIRKRAIIQRIPLAATLPWNENAWSPKIQDTMTLWDPEVRISLDRLCRVLKVTHGHQDFDGSMVADAWARGEKLKVMKYCEADVEATRQCWARITGIRAT